MSDGGKGSKPRPYSVDQKTFDSNWDKIFKKPEVDPVARDNEEYWKDAERQVRMNEALRKDK